MYGYSEELIPLTIENVLRRVSQENIFSLLLGEKPKLNTYYVSLVREDSNPGCEFMWYGNKLMFIDFGHVKHHMDCFGVICERNKINLADSLLLVNNHFKLGLNGTGVPAKIKFEVLYKKTIKKNDTKIIFKPRKFQIKDKLYWEQYGITKQNLIDDKVYAVVWYKFYSKKLNKVITIRPQNITYSYFEFSPRMKIYSPYSPKKNGKWISNAEMNDVGGLRSFHIHGDILVITKSYKDYRCIKNFNVNTIWFQSEGIIPDTEKLIGLIKNYKEFIVIYDNDNAGIKASNYLVSTLNSHFPGKARNVFVPKYNNVTDSSDLYKQKGKLEFLKFLVINNII